MTLDAFLSPEDASRVSKSLQKLALHGMDHMALAGGLALELHMARVSNSAVMRQLNDIDFIAPALNDLPGTLSSDMLFRHVHPGDPPGKMMLQAVDPETKVRIDIFRAYGSEMERVAETKVAGIALRMVSLEDLFARLARLCWDLTAGRPVAPKIARDFMRMAEIDQPNEIQNIWHEHRKPQMPTDFAEAVAQLRTVIHARFDLLNAPDFSTNVHEVCKRCTPRGEFPLADAGKILSILGYC